MFAIVKLGNKQFKVQAGDYIRVPYLEDILIDGSKGPVELPILAVGTETGLALEASELKTSKVTAGVLREGSTRKILVFKKKRRKGYRRTKGHRQKYIDLRILEIASGGSKSTAPVVKATAKTATDAKATAKTTTATKAKTATVKSTAAKTDTAKTTTATPATAKSTAAKAKSTPTTKTDKPSTSETKNKTTNKKDN